MREFVDGVLEIIGCCNSYHRKSAETLFRLCRGKIRFWLASFLRLSVVGGYALDRYMGGVKIEGRGRGRGKRGEEKKKGKKDVPSASKKTSSNWP